MNKKDVVQIIVIADRSGSMQSIKTDAIGGFNAFIEKQQKLDGKAEVTLVLFDDKYEVVYKDKDISIVDKLDDKTFIPRGSTALYDAMGKTIATLNEERADGNEAVMPEKVMFAIITDGAENASTEFKRDTVMDQVKECKAKGWNFIYLCADEKGLKDGQKIFGIGSTHAFTADTGGTCRAYQKMSQSVASYRGDIGDVLDDAQVTHNIGDDDGQANGDS